MRATVLVRTRPDVLDAQGTAVRDTLVALGFDGVRDVRIGRLIELDVSEGTDVQRLCDALLVHPAIEVAEVMALPARDT